MLEGLFLSFVAVLRGVFLISSLDNSVIIPQSAWSYIGYV